MLLFKHFCSKIKEPGNGRSNSVENYIKNYAHFYAIENWKQEQDDGGGGGRGVPLSPRIHQEHTFRHRIPAESWQEYLDRIKEYVEAVKTR